MASFLQEVVPRWLDGLGAPPPDAAAGGERQVFGLPVLRWLQVGVGVLAVTLVASIIWRIEATVALSHAQTQPLGNVEAVRSDWTDLTDGVATTQSQIQRMLGDYAAFQGTQVNWPPVLRQVFAFRSPDIAYTYLSQQGTTLTLEGRASHYPALIAFIDLLQRSNLFSSVSLQSASIDDQGLPSGLPGIAVTPMAPPPGTQSAQVTPTPFVMDQFKPSSATHFLLLSRSRVNEPSAGSMAAGTIRGKILDTEGRLVPGLTVSVSSCCPEWSAMYPPANATMSTGTFTFAVPPDHTYEVRVADGRSETARDIVVSKNDAGGAVWDVVFLKAEAYDDVASGLVTHRGSDSPSLLPPGEPALSALLPPNAGIAFSIRLEVKPRSAQP